jgi:hypothetical protein
MKSLWTILLMSKKMINKLLTLLFTCLSFRSQWVWIFHVPLKLSSLNICLIIARISVALYRRFAQNLIHTHSSSVGYIGKSHQTRHKTPKKKGWKKSASPPSYVTLYTVPLRYYNNCIDDSTSPVNYGYTNIHIKCFINLNYLIFVHIIDCKLV